MNATHTIVTVLIALGQAFAQVPEAWKDWPPEVLDGVVPVQLDAIIPDRAAAAASIPAAVGRQPATSAGVAAGLRTWLHRRTLLCLPPSATHRSTADAEREVKDIAQQLAKLDAEVIGSLLPTLMRDGDAELAAAICQGLPPQHATHPAVLDGLVRAASFARTHYRPDIAKALVSAAATEPAGGSHEVSLHLGMAHEKLGDYGAALALYEQLLLQADDRRVRAGAQRHAAFCLMHMGDLDGALARHMTVAADYGDLHPESVLSIAWTLTLMHEHADAITAFMRALDRFSDRSRMRQEAQFRIGYCYERQRAHEEALKWYDLLVQEGDDTSRHFAPAVAHAERCRAAVKSSTRAWDVVRRRAANIVPFDGRFHWRPLLRPGCGVRVEHPSLLTGLPRALTALPARPTRVVVPLMSFGRADGDVVREAGDRAGKGAWTVDPGELRSIAAGLRKLGVELWGELQLSGAAVLRRDDGGRAIDTDVEEPRIPARASEANVHPQVDAIPLVPALRRAALDDISAGLAQLGDCLDGLVLGCALSPRTLTGLSEEAVHAYEDHAHTSVPWDSNHDSPEFWEWCAWRTDSVSRLVTDIAELWSQTRRGEACRLALYAYADPWRWHAVQRNAGQDVSTWLRCAHVDEVIVVPAAGWSSSSAANCDTLSYAGQIAAATGAKPTLTALVSAAGATSELLGPTGEAANGTIVCIDSTDDLKLVLRGA